MGPRLWRGCVAGWIVACALSLQAAPAGADGRVVISDGELVYESDATDRDSLVLRLAGGELVLDNAPQALANGAGCDRLTPSSLQCALTDLTGVRLDLRDGDDGASVLDDLGLRTTLDGGVGVDTLVSHAGGDIVLGGPGNDRLRDDENAGGGDQFSGGNGDDDIVVARGNDDVTGGTGIDTVLLQGGRDDIVRLDDVANDGAAGEAKNIRTSIEVVDGGGGADRLSGNDDPNTLLGGAGNDLLDGAEGRDVLDGGPGADGLNGGPDVDRVEYPAIEGQTVTVDGVADDGAPGELDNVHVDVEDVAGGPGDDVLVGSAGANVLDGGPGNDRLDGGGEIDTYAGGSGADTVLARDGRPESVDCGGDVDDGLGDSIDTLQGCENVAVSSELEADADRDGATKPGDCNDADAAIRPGALDIVENGVDEDCSGADAPDLDRDRDGFGRPQDCDDASARIHPGARERPGNRVDENCDGTRDALALINAGVSHEFVLVTRGAQVRGKRVVLLTVTRLPAGSRVTITCRPPRGARGAPRPCGFRRKTFRVRSATAELALARLFKRRVLALRTVIAVTITAPELKGKRLTYRLTRASKRPRLECVRPNRKRTPC